MTLPDGFAPTYHVELLCEVTPDIQKQPLFDAIRKWCPAAEPLDGKTDAGLLAFAHPDHLVSFSEGDIPAQTLIAVADKGPDRARLEPAIQQSWGFPSARQVVERSKACVLVTDVMSSHLDHRERVELFLNVVRATLDVVPAAGINWIPSGQITNPMEFRQAFGGTPAERMFAGPINVRFFRIENSPGEMIMDTLGLAAVGLPDLQCHFRQLDPEDVSRMLYSTAYYIFDHGDVIEDGNTVEGAVPGSKWVCQHEDALLEPRRGVLDVIPELPSLREIGRSGA